MPHPAKSPACTAPELLELEPSSNPWRVSSSNLEVGAFFARGRYELLPAIARGGTSVVHAVHDHVLDRRIAGKFMWVEGDDDALFAELEARATARLCHPNIVTVYDAGLWGKMPYLLMELLSGGTLAHEIALGPLAAPRALYMLREIASALAHAHERGVLHLDLKPGNVHVGEQGLVKLLDFGVGSTRLKLAAGAEAPAISSEPGASLVVGTPCYMAPEQWNLEPLDERTDVWALGMLLYECLSGEVLGEGLLSVGTLTAGTSYRPPSLPHDLGLPGMFDQVIERSLAVDPRRRYQTAREFLQMLRVLEQVVSESERTRLSSSERRLLAAASLLECDFDASELGRLTAVPVALVAGRLTNLAEKSLVRAFRGGGGLRYRTSDPELCRACFEQLSQAQRMVMLERLASCLRR